MASLLGLAVLLVLVCTSRACRTLQQVPSGPADALLALPAALTNWEAATAGVPGVPWQPGSEPCGGSGGGGGTPWKGVQCSAEGQVVALQLPGLGLAGTLPPGLLAALPALQRLDLSGNALTAGLPAGWAGAALVSLNLSGNGGLTGGLPPAWGAALPALTELRLQGNNLTGVLPLEWTDGGLAQPATLEPRPNNTRLCGPVPPLDPRLYNPAAREGDRAGTTLQLVQRDLLAPGSAVTLTNWLGMCMTPCTVTGEQANPPEWVDPAGLTWPPTIQTNAFDLSFVFNMSISDLLLLNPGLSTFRTGDRLALACYDWAEERKRVAYHGGDMAYGKCAGGHQVAGTEGLAGAMAAARVVLTLPGSSEQQQGAYSGSLGPPATPGGASQLVEPAFWFVDLLAPFQITSVFLTASASAPLRNASLYIGSDAASVFGNTRVASGITVEAGGQLAVPGNAVVGRYVIVYTGSAAEGQMSLANVQVFTFETNAAANKPASASSLATIDRGGAGLALQSLVDNNASSCVSIQADPSSAVDDGTAWVFVDLGYSGAVGAVAVAAGPDSPAGAAQVYVSDRPRDTLAVVTLCAELALVPGGWAVGSCGLVGRYVTLAIPGAGANDDYDLCELQAALAVQPLLQDSDSVTFNPAGHGSRSTGGGGEGGVNGGAVAGIVLAATIGVAALLGSAVLALRYVRWRRHWLEQQQQVADALSSKGGDSPRSTALSHDMDGSRHGGSVRGGSQHGGTALPAHLLRSDSRNGGSRNGGVSRLSAGSSAELPEPRASFAHGSIEPHGSVELTGSKVPSSPKAAATVPPGHAHPSAKKLSEWELLSAFAKSLRHSSRRSTLTMAASQPGSAAYNASLLPRVRVADLQRAQTLPLDAALRVAPGGADVSAQDIQLIECVGEGSYGQVWRARFFGATVAVKVFARPTASAVVGSASSPWRMGLGDLGREAQLMAALRHPNVCRYLGACLDPPCLVMEYCSRKSLDGLLAAGLASPQMAKELDWQRLLGMAYDAAKGMLYLHRKGIAHRDLKSANLLVDGHWAVKVADFSFSRALQEDKRASTVIMANPRWLAPEVLDGQPGQLPADVWAFGTVIWELLSWCLPYSDMNTYQIISHVQHTGKAGLDVPAAPPAGQFEGLPRLVALMNACHAVDPEARPKFDEIVTAVGELLEAESNVQLTTTNPADPPAQPRQQMTIRPAAGGHAYQAMAALMKQRQAALRGNSGDPQCGEGPSAGGAPGGAPAASPFAAPPPWAAPPAVLEGAPTPDGAPAPGLVQGVQSA